MGASPPDTTSDKCNGRPGWGLTLLNWALPGAGFMLVGRIGRGAAQAGIVLGTFVIGLALSGGVMWPAWHGMGQDIAIINNIVFLIQMGGGLPALASLLGNLGGVEWLGGLPWHPYYELGAYYLVVAGALNYYATCNFHDRLVSHNSRYQEQEGIGAAR